VIQEKGDNNKYQKKVLNQTIKNFYWISSKVSEKIVDRV
tara:strand:- start:538 stop:654 length:117 start_codon:yes stop_codon:yes gene_type:complete